ncbi:hypothetical protein Aab01nite_14690 [Paractinoplanes abujensis]|uniref:SnoaL-like domain-containing protein n=1 Tax=Paractinoplanes abujensis TaxID=882441 RepID=A0A7W7CPA2_9ACTN|nr:nuclear transport factor 2 family protein [Actinoplanes abujensis]MBB4690708.1 hypothetical protein [Actinoplanes abujensis]GID17879.1 hypothetical protein Aab01nite_14690 [Actinoplanes abujensis]
MTTNVSELVDGWLRLWNGELDRAAGLLTPDFRVHAALMGGGDGSALSGPEGLAGWIAQTRAAFTSLTFAVEVGPIAQDDLLAVRWTATGTYGGGFPGATAEPGTPIAFTGTDTLRIAGDRLAEYWVNSDIHVLFAQLEVS